ncbi:actin-like ATPase domain-containing protein [Rhizophagus irregularis]|uniref:Actin-like ATPase domain-containing protein n=1 Tax=Rhizophagus irregularis TaxID=588596 RepID=A0A2N0QDX1_9GLOM|nr:actin-like ATPase domain-containing protein [Rhizophagus irregularis]
MSWRNDIRVVVGLDFGATYSGFAYLHVSGAESICTNDKWPGKSGVFKTNTVLQYDSKFENVVEWGFPAISNRKNKVRPVELFKLYLGNLQENLKPRLPDKLGYKKAITDYLCEIGKLAKETIMKKWNGIDFTENVLFVLTVPAEFSEKDKNIMRNCAHKAKLIKNKSSRKLEFTTEPEAAALYCMNKLQEHGLSIGTTFMIVDCGGGTVDLTTRMLIENQRLSEITERIGDFCGSTFIDREFINFLREKLGTRAIDKLIENHYGQYQNMIQEFCEYAKYLFTGDKGFLYELDIEDNPLSQYLSEETKKIMRRNEWLICIKYNDIKKMFESIVDRIIRLIYVQLSNNRKTCSAMFLVGGFSESKYLQKKIRDEFRHKVKIISVPSQPEAAIARGATIYGLSLKNSSRTEEMNNYVFAIHTRVLKFTYGIKVLGTWKEGEHPPHRKIYGNRIYLFDTFVKRGTQVEVGKESPPKSGYTPLNPSQTGLKFELYKTSKYGVKYFEEDEDVDNEDENEEDKENKMELVGTLRIDLPDIHLACKRSVTFGFYFGDMEITAFARNEVNGQNFQTKFEIEEF